MSLGEAYCVPPENPLWVQMVGRPSSIALRMKRSPTCGSDGS